MDLIQTAVGTKWVSTMTCIGLPGATRGTAAEKSQAAQEPLLSSDYTKINAYIMTERAFTIYNKLSFCTFLNPALLNFP